MGSSREFFGRVHGAYNAQAIYGRGLRPEVYVLAPRRHVNEHDLVVVEFHIHVGAGTGSEIIIIYIVNLDHGYHGYGPPCLKAF